jgi:hypothetical protein
MFMARFLHNFQIEFRLLDGRTFVSAAGHSGQVASPPPYLEVHLVHCDALPYHRPVYSAAGIK